MTKKDMHVLHIIDSGGLYGAEMMLLNLAGEQQRMGMRPCIASIGEPHVGVKAIEQRADQLGIALQRFRMRPGPNWIGAADVLRFARRNHFNLLHSHGYKANILFGLLPARWRRLPLVTTVHGYTSVSRGWSKMGLYEWLDRRMLPRMDAVVLVNRGMLGHPRLASLNRRRCHVIDNGISERLPVHATVDSSLASFCDHPFVIGAIGRLSDEKGFDVLVEAMARILDSGLPARLVLIGDGRRRQDLARQIRTLRLEDHVRMTGFLENGAAYIPLFRVLAMPSLTEGLPITLLEAMRAGVPVVASQVGGIPRVITHNHCGLLTRPADPAELAENIERLHTDDALNHRLASNAHRQFMQKYTSGKMAFRYLSLYHRIIQGSNQSNAHQS
jgi:glycosyltransferase involved in cell wall biosynthesis